MTNRTQNRRGLAALIPTDGANRSRDDRPRVVDAGPPETTAPRVQSTVLPAAVAGLELVSVRPLQVVPNPKQPRTEFDPDALTELAQSLGDVGFLQPIVVRRIGSPTDTDQQTETTMTQPADSPVADTQPSNSILDKANTNLTKAQTTLDALTNVSKQSFIASVITKFGGWLTMLGAVLLDNWEIAVCAGIIILAGLIYLHYSRKRAHERTMVILER